LNLKPETSHTWDMGVERHSLDNRVMVSATYFQSTSHSLINFFSCPFSDVDPRCSVFGGYYANIGETVAHGVELQSAWHLNTAVTLAANYTYSGTEDRSVGASTYGKVLPRRPQNAANVSVAYQSQSQWSAILAARYSGSSFDDAANSVTLGGYALIDARVSYSIRDHLEIYARIENAAGTHYETAYRYGAPGRAGYIGFRTGF